MSSLSLYGLRDPVETIELIPIAIAGRPIVSGVLELWKKFNEDYALANSRERAEMYGWEDDYYNFLKNYYFYAWTDDEYEENKFYDRDDPDNKKICQMLFEDLQKVVHYWLSVEMDKINYYKDKIKKTSLKLNKFMSQYRQKLLDNLNERISIAFLQDCCHHISQAFGKYNVDGEVYLSKLIGYVSEMTKNNKLISMR